MRLLAPVGPTAGLFLAALALAGCNKKDKDAVEGDDTDSGMDDPVDPFAGHDIGAWLSLEATPDGKVAAAAYDRTQDGLVYGTTSPTSVSWAWEQVDSFPDENGLNPGDAGKYASMVLTSDGTPWIAYQDTTNGSLKVSTKSGGAWSAAVADTSGGARPDAGRWASIALTPAGTPVIAHHAEDTGTLRVVRWDGSTWAKDTPIEGTDAVDETGATISADVGEYAKLAIGPKGTEYIAFYDRAWGDLKLAMNAGSGWTVETVDSDGDVGQWPDIVIAGGQVYIAYHDVTNQDLKLATGSPGAWSIETIDTGDFVGADAAVLVSGSEVKIAYFDGVGNDVKIAVKKGADWHKTLLAGTDSALGYHNEVVTVGGSTYAGCYDYTSRSVWLGAL